MGWGEKKPIRIAIIPAQWKLPRTFQFEKKENNEFLVFDDGAPPTENDRIAEIADGEWLVILRWSAEALASAAYRIAFWYTEQIGEVLYRDGVPAYWNQMSAAEAGVNATKQALYYAILRARTAIEESRAIALYNTYGFGYALGMNFKNSNGKREMLWPEDLREILATGKTRNSCRIY